MTKIRWTAKWYDFDENCQRQWWRRRQQRRQWQRDNNTFGFHTHMHTYICVCACMFFQWGFTHVKRKECTLLWLLGSAYHFCHITNNNVRLCGILCQLTREQNKLNPVSTKKARTQWIIETEIMIISFMAIETAVVNAFFFIFIWLSFFIVALVLVLVGGFFLSRGFHCIRLLLLTTDGQLEMCVGRFRFRSCTIVSRHLPLIYLPEPYFS